MPLSPQQLDWMQRYASGAPPEELRSQIPMLYNAPDDAAMRAAFAPHEDARTAGNGPSLGYQYDPSQLQPMAPPVATDAGGQKFLRALGASETTSPLGAVGDSRAQMPVVEDPNAPYAPVPKEEMRIGLTAAPVVQQEPFDPVAREMQREGLASARGGGGRVVPGGEQLSSRTVKHVLHGRANPETLAELEAAGIDAQGMAVGQGESQATGLEKVAAQQRKHAQDAHVQLADYNRNLASKQAENDIRQAELDDMRADIKRNPASYWSGDTGNDAVKAIGLTLLGIVGGPRLIMQAVEQDLAHKEKSRDLQVNMLQDRLSRFEKTLPSPESAQMYRRSLALDAAASEAESMANMAKSEDARQRGFALAEQLRMEALKAKAAGETKSLGEEEIKTANVPTKYVGGVKRKTLAERAKDNGLTPEEEARLEITGQLPGAGSGPKNELDLAKTKYARSVAVRLPEGNEASAHDAEEAAAMRGVFDGARQLNANYDDTLRVVKQHGGSTKWDRESLGRVKANVADTILALKQAKQLGVLSASDLELVKPLSGADAEDWVPGPGFEGALKRAKELINSAEQRGRERLTVGPWSNEYATSPAGAPGSTFKPEKR